MRQVLAVVCVMLVVGVVVAEKPARVAAPAVDAVEPANKLNFKGEIVSFKDGKLTLLVEKEERSYSLAEKAQCMNAEGMAIKDREKDLPKGTKVQVWLNEKNEVKKIQIEK